MQAVGGTMSKFVTLPLAAAGVAAVKFAADYDQSLTNAVSVTGKTGKAAQMAKKDMDGLAKSLGQQTAFSAKEAADAMYDLASSGWDAQDMGKGLRGIMDLAAATQSDLASTTETVTATLGQFGLEAKDSGRISDVFTKAIGSSKANMDRLSMSMKTVGPVANALGYSVEDTTAVLSHLYDAGFEGEQAGTALRGALSSLMNPVGETKKGLDAIGVSMDEVNPKTNSFTDILRTLKAAGMDATTATQIFGREAAPAMLAVSDKAGGIDKLTKSLDNAGGTAKRVADQQLNTLSGQLKILLGSLQTAAITIGQKFLPALKGMVSFLTPLVNKFASLPAPVMAVALGIAAFAAALGPLLVVVGMAVSALGSLVLVTGGAGVAASLGLAAGAVGTFLVAAAPFIAVAAAMGLAGIVIFRNWSKVKAAFQPLMPIVNAVKNAFNNLKTVIGGLINGSTGTNAFRRAFVSLPGPVQNAIKLIVIAWRQLKTSFSQVRAAVMPILKQIGNGIKVGLVAAFRFLLTQGRQLVAWFKTNWPQIKATVVPVIQFIGRIIRTVLVAAFKFALQNARLVVNWFKQNWPLIKQTAQVVGNALKRIIQGSFNRIKAIIWPVVKAIVAFWRSNWNSIKGILQATWNIIKSVIQTAIRNVLNIIKLVMQIITGDWRGAWQTIKNIARDNWNNIKTIIKAALNIIKNIVKIAMNNIRAIWEAALRKIREWAQAWGRRIREIFSALSSWAKDLWRRAWDGIRGIWESGTRRVREWVSGWRDRLKNIMVDLKEAIWGAMKSIGKALWDPIQAGWNKAKKIWNSIIDAIAGVADDFGLDSVKKSLEGAKFGGGGGNAPASPAQKRAKGGIERGGGIANGATYLPATIMGEAGPEGYARLDKYTPQSMEAARAIMQSPNAPPEYTIPKNVLGKKARYSSEGSVSRNPVGTVYGNSHAGSFLGWDSVNRGTGVMSLNVQDTKFRSEYEQAANSWNQGNTPVKVATTTSPPYVTVYDYPFGNTGWAGSADIMEDGSGVIKNNLSASPPSWQAIATHETGHHLGMAHGIPTPSIMNYASLFSTGGAAVENDYAALNQLWSGKKYTSGPGFSGGGGILGAITNPVATFWDKTIQPMADKFTGALGEGNIMNQVLAGAGKDLVGGLREKVVGSGGSGGVGGPISGSQAEVAKQFAAGAEGRGIPGPLPVMTALVESGMKNLNYGDRDSVGYFQQRPSQGWGTPEQLQDPAYALDAFLDVAEQYKGQYGNDASSLGAWAQAVQRSAFPDRYAQEYGRAKELIGYADGGMPTKPHQAVVEPHDLYLPLDNQRVMQSAQTALGTAELRNEMQQMRKTLNDTLVRQERQMVNVQQWARAQEAATRQAIGSGRADSELGNYMLKALD